MRQITVLSMITLDGVMQAPGAPGEDTSGGFKYGGWVAPYGDEIIGKVMQKVMAPSDILLGRKTFDIWENYWPQHEQGWPGINEVSKYVLSSTRKSSDWENTVFLNNLEAIQRLKDAPNDGATNLQVWGSSQLVQLLLKNNLVDELWLLIYPLTLGTGKKLFQDGPIPAAFKLVDSVVSPSGVIIANYMRDGEVQTGTVGE